MIVEQIWTGNAYRNFNYLIVCPGRGEALAVDPLDHEKCLSRAKAKGWQHHAGHQHARTRRPHRRQRSRDRRDRRKAARAQKRRRAVSAASIGGSRPATSSRLANAWNCSRSTRPGTR